MPTNALPSTSPSPRTKVLLPLTALVLAGHWLALGGRIDLWPDQWSQPGSQLDAAPSDVLKSADMPALDSSLAPATLPAPVTIANVRWIAPPAPPVPAPPPPEPAPPPAQPVKIAKQKPLPEPEPVIETPEPEPAPIAAMPERVEVPIEPETPVEPIPVVPPQDNPTALSAPEGVPKPAAPDEPAALAASAAVGSANGAGAADKGAVLPLVTPVPNATLNYEVTGQAKGFTYHAGGTLNWQQDGTTYSARLEVSAFLLGAYVQTSTGQITPQGLAPERFAIKRRKSEKAAHFERATGRIRYSNNAPDAPLLPGAQDQLSVTLQLASLLYTYDNLGGSSTVTLPVSSDGSSEPWQFSVEALKPLNLPAGQVPARLLTRAPRREFDKTVQLWLAPSLANLPVRMRITEHNGDYLDMVLEDLPETAAPQNQKPES